MPMHIFDSNEMALVGGIIDEAIKLAHLHIFLEFLLTFD